MVTCNHFSSPSSQEKMYFMLPSSSVWRLYFLHSMEIGLRIFSTPFSVWGFGAITTLDCDTFSTEMSIFLIKPCFYRTWSPYMDLRLPVQFWVCDPQYSFVPICILLWIEPRVHICIPVDDFQTKFFCRLASLFFSYRACSFSSRYFVLFILSWIQCLHLRLKSPCRHSRGCMCFIIQVPMA